MRSEAPVASLQARSVDGLESLGRCPALGPDRAPRRPLDRQDCSKTVRSLVTPGKIIAEGTRPRRRSLTGMAADGERSSAGRTCRVSPGSGWFQGIRRHREWPSRVWRDAATPQEAGTACAPAKATLAHDGPGDPPHPLPCGDRPAPLGPPGTSVAAPAAHSSMGATRRGVEPRARSGRSFAGSLVASGSIG